MKSSSTQNRSSAEKADERFDPFCDRRCRDIRNHLCLSFVDGLDRMNPLVFQKEIGKWRAADLAPAQAEYIDDRERRYFKVFDHIRKSNIDDAITRALICWNEGLFFEVHQILEDLWDTAIGERREAIKGLIQAAGVYVHLEARRGEAARKLGQRAAERLNRLRHCFPFLSNLDELLERLEMADPNPPTLIPSCAISPG